MLRELGSREHRTNLILLKSNEINVLLEMKKDVTIESL